jgi:hypothetical protein
MNDMLAYSTLTGRCEQQYRDQLLRFIPPLDRIFLSDFYARQSAEMKAAADKNKSTRS